MAGVIAPEQIVAEAREWAGTRWRHQGHDKGLSTDCAGLVLGVGQNTGAFDASPFTSEMRREFGGYNRAPSPGKMRRALDLLLVRVPDMRDLRPGDVVYLQYDERQHVVIPQHLAIVTEGGWVPGGRMIHAMMAARKVVEHGIGDTWHRRYHRGYRYPAVQRWMEAER